jgi:hypothetical protein
MQKAQELKPAGVSRRTALKAFGTGIGTVAALPWLSDEGLLAFARIQESNAPPQPKVFSASQFATLELLVDAIIPTDDRSPAKRPASPTHRSAGQRGDRRLSWNGSAGSRRSTKPQRIPRAVRQTLAAQVDAILQTISRNEKSPQTPSKPFVMSKQATIRGTARRRSAFDELHYKGNVFLRTSWGQRDGGLSDLRSETCKQRYRVQEMTTGGQKIRSFLFFEKTILLIS